MACRASFRITGPDQPSTLPTSRERGLVRIAVLPDDDAVGVEDDLVATLRRPLAEQIPGAALNAGGATSCRSGRANHIVLAQRVDVVRRAGRGRLWIGRPSDQERDRYKQRN